MKIYTIQMGQWRKAKEKGLDILDTTVKSGEEKLAPTWDMVRTIKDGGGAEDEALYTKMYLAKLKASFLQDREYWKELLSREYVVLACYCKAGTFCHRYILADVLLKICQNQSIPCELVGEVT